MESAEVELVETGAKRDRRGRRIASEAERERLLTEYDCSALTQRAFAQREGIHYNTFIWWLKQRRERGKHVKRKTLPPVRFEEYRLPAVASSPEPPPPVPLEVCLPDGTIVRGGTASELITMAKALRS
jgi:transposase-like protein